MVKQFNVMLAYTCFGNEVDNIVLENETLTCDGNVNMV